MYEIYKSFDEGFEVCGIFFDISKAFNRDENVTGGMTVLYSNF